MSAHAGGDGAHLTGTSGGVSVEAAASNAAITIGDGQNIGGVAGIGAVATTSEGSGTTTAYINASTASVTGGGLKVLALGFDTASADATAASGGILAAGDAANAQATTKPTINGYIDHDATVNVAGGAAVDANSTTQANANASGSSLSLVVALGALGGGSTSAVTDSPTVTATVNKNASVTTSGGIEVLAQHDQPLDLSTRPYTDGTFTAGSTSVSTANDTITLPGPHGLSTGDRVTYLAEGNMPIGGLTDSASYSVIKYSDTALRLGVTFTGANADATTGTITFNTLHNLLNGQAVTFGIVGGSAVAGLSVGTTYYVRVLDPHTIQLFTNAAQASAAPETFDASAVNSSTGTITLPGHGFTENQAVTYYAPPAQPFTSDNVDGNANTITIQNEPFSTGDHVIYSTKSNDTVGGLSNNQDYYVIKVDDNTIQLAATADDAANDNPISISVPASEGTHFVNLVPLGGLADRHPYCVHVVDANHIQLKGTPGGKVLAIDATNVMGTQSLGLAGVHLDGSGITNTQYLYIDFTGTGSGTQQLSGAGQALSLFGQNGLSTAKASGSAGALLFADSSVQATADTTGTTVTATVDDNATMAAGTDLSLLAQSSANDLALALTSSGGLISCGSATTTLTLDQAVTTVIGDSASLSAGQDAHIDAESHFYAASDATGSGGGFVSGDSAETDANLTHDTEVDVGSKATVAAGGNLDMLATVYLGGSLGAYSEEGGFGVAPSANANYNVGSSDNRQTVQVLVGSGAVVSAEKVATLKADLCTDGNIGVAAKADAQSSLLADVDGHSTLTVTSLALVEVDSGASVTGHDQLLVWAEHEAIDNIMQGEADGGAIASHHESAELDPDTQSNIVGQAGATFASSDLVVQARVEPTAITMVQGNNPDQPFNWTPVRSIAFDSNVIALAGDPWLTVDASGNVTSAHVNYQSTGSRVIVSSLNDNNIQPVQFITNSLDPQYPAGVITGSQSTITFRQTFNKVTIINNSQKDLEIDGIDVLNHSPLSVSISVDDDSGFQFAIGYTFGTSLVQIRNQGAGTPAIYLQGPINNPIGETDISNATGDIVSAGPSAVVRTNVFHVAATAGNVGSLTTPIPVQLVQSQGRAIGLAGTAGKTLSLDLTPTARDPAVTSFNLPFDSLIAGGDLNLIFEASVTQLALGSTPVYFASVSEPLVPQITAPVFAHFPPAGNDAEPHINFDLGLFGTAGPTPQTINTAYTLSLVQAGGDINILARPQTTTITITGNTNILASGKTNVQTNGNITLTETNGDMRAGTITSTAGNVTLTAPASIVDAKNDGTTNVSGAKLTFTAISGGIGAFGDHLSIVSTLLKATAVQDVFITEVTGDLNIDTVTTSSGVTLNGAARILDADQSSTLDVSGKYAVLVSGSGVGQSNHPLQTQVLNLEGSGGTGGFWLMNQGALIIGNITSLDGLAATGPIIVTAASPITILEDVISQNAVSLTASASAQPGNDLTAPNPVKITGQSVTLTAGGNVRLSPGCLVQATGAILVQGGGTLTADYSVTFNGGTVTFVVPGDAYIGPNSLVHAGTAISFQENNLMVDTGTKILGGSLHVQSGADVTLEPGTVVRATGDITIQDENLTVSKAVTVDGGTVNLLSRTNIYAGPDSLLRAATDLEICGAVGNTHAGVGTLITIYGQLAAPLIDVKGGKNNDTIDLNLQSRVGTLNVYEYGGNDYISADADLINGGDGNDVIFGGPGANTIVCGAGQNYIDGGGGADVITSGTGDSVLIARGNAGATITAGGGNDVIYGSGGPDTIQGGSGNDRIYGGNGNDTIYGGGGNDVIVCGSGTDYVEGGNGNDLIVAGPGNDTIYAYGKNSAGDNHSTHYIYGGGNTHIYGSAGNDYLFGTGNDVIVPGGPGSWVQSGGNYVPPDTTVPPIPLAPGNATNNRASGASLPDTPNVPGCWTELSGSGSATGLSGDLGVATDPTIVAGTTGPFAAWADARSGNYEIYVAQYASGQWQELAGSADSGGVTNTASQSRRPSITLGADGEPIVAWTEFTGTSSDIRVARYDPTANGGHGGWVALGNSLSGGGISNTGAADDAVVLNTSAGPVVQWLDSSSGVTEVYAKRFSAGAWSALGTGAAGGSGISASAANVSDLAACTDGTKVAAAWSQADPSGHRQVYVKEFNGTAWNQLSGSASGTGVSASTGASQAPSVAYLGGSLFVAWQQEAGPGLLPVNICAAQYTNGAWAAAGTGALSAGGVSHSSGMATQPRLAANDGKLCLAWVDNELQSHTATSLNLYTEVWNGTSFVEEAPGDASYQGIAAASGQFRTLALTVDPSGHPFVAWDDAAAGRPCVYVRGNTFNLHRLFTAGGSTSIQSILDTQGPGQGDVIVVAPGTNSAGGLNITSKDAGVLILGAPDGSTGIQGTISVTGAAGVILQRLTIGGGINASGSDRLAVLDDTIKGAGLTLNGGANVSVAQDTFTGTTGIQFAAPASGYVGGNTIQASGTGLNISAAFNGLIFGNDISQAATGVAYAAAATLSANRIHNSTTGVNVTTADEPSGLGFVGAALANQIYSNQTGVTLAPGARMRGQHIYSNTTGVTGSGILGGDELDTANVIEGNTTGVNFNGTIQFNRIAGNGVGILATNTQIIVHNLIYQNTQDGILVDDVADVRIVSNTIDCPLGDGVHLQNGSGNVEVRDNIFWAQTGYDLYVANDSQTGFFSDYNDLYATGTGRVAYWTKDFVDILDFQADVAAFDLHSIGRTVVNPQWAEPRFYDRAGADYRVFDMVAGQRFSSPTVDSADPLTDEGLPASYTNLLTNPGFEAGVTGWNVDVGAATRSSNPAPFSGGSYFFAGQNPQGFAQQTVNLQAAGFTAAQLDGQGLVAVFGGRVRSLDETPPDQGQIKLEFLDANNAVIGTGGLSVAQNLSDRWELIGGRLQLPQGTRSLLFRFEANRMSGTDNNSFLDGAFVYVRNDTVAPDQGALGNTPAQNTNSTRTHLALRFPDLYTDWEKNSQHLILWNSYNNSSQSNVRIDLYQDDPVLGPKLLTTIAASVPDTGSYLWIPSNSGINYGTYGLRIQISLVNDKSVVDRGTETFTVPESGSTYYVNGGTTANTEYTTAVGSNRNTGKTPATPKPNPVNVLRTYDLNSGAVLDVDTGVYPLIYPLVMSARPGVGLGTDYGFLLRGPTDLSRTAEFTTAIPNNPNQVLLLLDNANLMQIRFLTLTGGQHGLYATDGTTGLVAERLTVRNNAQEGILFDNASSFTLLKDITVYGHSGYDGLSISDGAGGLIQNLVSYDNQNGLDVGNVQALSVSGARIYSNSAAGVEETGFGTATFDSLSVYGNAVGMDLHGSATITNSEVFDNVGEGIYAYFNPLTLQSSKVHGNTDGVVIGAGQITSSQIYGNTGAGIRGDYFPVTITGNTICSNQYGIFLSTLAEGTSTLSNNLIYADSDSAIHIEQTELGGFAIVNNTIYEPTANGVYASASGNIALRNNIIWTQQGYGIYISNDSQTGFSSDFNDLYATGSGKVGYWQADRATLADWHYATIQDADSMGADPLFVNPVGADAVLGAPNTQGLTASYYPNATWTGPATLTQVERQPGYQGSGQPDPSLPADNWSGAWQGFIRLEAAGDYTFYVNSLGPQQLIVNGQSLVNDASDPGVERAVTYHASSAGWVSFIYKAADTSGQINAQVQWATPYSGRAALLPGQISTASTHLNGADDNFHEQSLYGSFKPGVGFTNDSQQSPAINRGDPNDSFANEPAPNGGYINLGAYGNTTEASKKPAQYILLMNPNGGENLQQQTTYTIRWRSDGFTGNVHIQFSSSGYSGPFADIAASAANTGSYAWPIASAACPVSGQCVIRISSVANASIADTNNAPFSVLAPITKYYVNDGAYDPAKDQYTLAPGNDANDGLTPGTPKATINAILSTYNLTYGDTIFVDSGVYNLASNIVIGNAHSGVTIQGPTRAGSVALLNRGNPASGSYAFEVNAAQGVTLSNLSITGAYDGVYVDNGSSGFTLQNSAAYGNVDSGLVVADAPSANATAKDNVFYGDPSDTSGNRRQTYGIYGMGQGLTLLRNLAWSDSDTGVYVLASAYEVSGCVVRDCPRGFYLQGTDAAGNSQAHDNVAYGIDNNAFEVRGYGQVYDNQAYDSDQGFSNFDSAVIHDNSAWANRIGFNAIGGTIANNRAYGNTDGIFLSYFYSITVTGNRVYNNAVGIYAITNGANNVIANNLVYNDTQKGIYLDNVQTDNGTMTVTNNTVMESSCNALEVAGNSQNVTLENNILWAAGSGNYALVVGNLAQQGFASDYNDFYATNGAKLGSWQSDFTSLAEWRYALGLDQHSLYANPQFVSPAGPDGILGYQSSAGLKFEYFGNNNFSGSPVTTLYDRAVSFEETGGAFRGLNGPNDNQSFRWTGQVYLASVGVYTFAIDTLSAQRLTINGTVVVDDFTNPSGKEQQGTYTAAAPGWVSLKLEVVDYSGPTEAYLYWATPGNGALRLLRAEEAAVGGVVQPALRYDSAPASTGLDDDFHLSSTAGSYHGGQWLKDAVDSPLIDAGDLNSPYSLEPGANGGRTNLGFEGDTAEASHSPAQFLQLLSADGFDKFRMGSPTLITWRSVGIDSSAQIQISLSTDNGVTYTPIALTPNTGAYAWNPGAQTLTGRIRLSYTTTGGGSIQDASSNSFVVGAAGHVYYVNDASRAGDQYTTAPGSNANTGTTPADPLASLSAVFHTYPLHSGDVIYVDTGLYSEPANIVLGAAQSGVTILGPTGAGAVLNRGNSSAASYAFELENAATVTLSNLSITGAYDGIHVDSSSANLTVENSAVYGNAEYGVVVDDNASASPLIKGNLFYGDSDTAVYVRAPAYEVAGNVARDCGRGFYLDDADAPVNGKAHDNVAYGIDGNAFEVRGSGQVYNNQAYDSGRGFVVYDSAVAHDNSAWADTTGFYGVSGTIANNRAYGNTKGIWLTSYITAPVGQAVTVTGNQVYNNAIGIYSDADIGNDYITNNLVYNDTQKGIYLYDVQDDNGTMTVTNNTVMELSCNAVEVGGDSQNVTLENNILWAGGSGNFALVVGNLAQQGFASDYNDFYCTSGAKLGSWQNAFTTLADWRYELGFDWHSLYANPQFVSPAGPDGILGYQSGAGLKFEYFGNNSFSGRRRRHYTTAPWTSARVQVRSGI